LLRYAQQMQLHFCFEIFRWQAWVLAQPPALVLVLELEQGLW
jgi:hypothetical protein